MSDILVITPVKDSIDTTLETARAIVCADGNIRHIIYDDFSSGESKKVLDKKKEELHYELIHLDEITTTPSPNYKLILEMAQQEALKMQVPLVIIESDVIVKKDTLIRLLKISRHSENCGLVGAVTINEEGKINFPYLNFKNETKELIATSHSLSFCCTLLSPALLQQFAFSELSSEKDWYDVFISRKSKSLGFQNYLAMNLPVIHKPHSSRPWKQLKYNNPVKYYIRKFFLRKDRI